MRGRKLAMSAAMAAFAAVAVMSGGASGQALIEELTELAAQHPQVRAGSELVTASEHGIDRAFAGYLPRVSIVGDVGREYTDSPTRRAAGQDEFVGTRRKGTVTVTQNVFEGLRTQAQVAGARLTRDATENDLEATRQRVLQEGAAAYFEVMKSMRLVDLARRNIETINTQLKLEDERVARGSGISVDVLFARSRLQLAEERLAAFMGELRNARARYQQVFGKPPVEDGLGMPPSISSAMPADQQQAVDIALREHPEIRASQLRGDIASERREGARANFFPRFDIVGRANYENDVEGVPGRRNDYSIGLQASYDLFKGFADKAELAQANSELSAVRTNHFHVARKVREAAEISMQDLGTLRERRGLLGSAVSIASEVFDSRRRLRDAGKETALNVLDAENEVYVAQINLTRVEFDERIAEFRVLQAIGRLTLTNVATAR